MRSAIENIITEYSKTPQQQLSKSKLLDSLYKVMGTSLSMEDKRQKLAIYLYREFKYLDDENIRKPILRVALQQILAIHDDEIHHKVSQHPELRFNTTLDEEIAGKIFEVIGRIGAYKIALYEVDKAIQKGLPAFPQAPEKAHVLGPLREEVAQLKLYIKAENNSNKIEAAVSKFLNKRSGMPVLRPLQQARHILIGHRDYLAHLNETHQIKLARENNTSYRPNLRAM